MQFEADILQTRAATKVFHHIDGIAIGSTVHALSRMGVFDYLSVDGSPVGVSELAARFHARTGYFHLAMKLFASQGFVRRTGDIAGGETAVSLTEAGREWIRWLPTYEMIAETMAVASSASVIDDSVGPRTVEMLRSHASLETDDSELGLRVRYHVQGIAVALVMGEIARHNGFRPFGMEAGTFVRFEDLPGSAPRLAAAFDLLERQGWAVCSDGKAALTPEGVFATVMAPQYYYPVCYIPTFGKVPEMLFGDRVAGLGRASNGTERHVDRELDIEFSGLVFNRTCRKPFLDVVLPLFDRDPIQDQPRCVVDTGSGDGTVLAELYRAVCERTRRGKVLDRHPLLMVGAEYNRVAQDITAERLSRLGVPHLVMYGDIGDPEALSATLSQHGIDPLDALHVSKSVIHNRVYSPPENREAADRWEPTSTAVFVSPSGDLIHARDLEYNLVEHFHKWIPWTRKHGMVVIEAHTMDPEIVARHLGRNIVTYLDASHGFSHQYLVEAEVFRRAAKQAGYHSLASVDLLKHMTGRPLLTIHHFVSSP